MNTGSNETIRRPFTRYVLPFIVFVSLGKLQTLGGAESVFWLYSLKISFTAFLFFFLFRGHWEEIQGKFEWPAVWLGVFCLIVWLLPYLLIHHESEIAVFNPNNIENKSFALLAISIRLIGACLVVPVIEEIIWRSFLMRFFVSQYFLNISLGTYTHFSFWLTAATFAVMHHPRDWLAAVIVAALYGYYLVRTKNLVGCMVAHGTTNLGLGLYVIIFERWTLWN